MVEFNIKTITLFVISLLVMAIIFPLAITTMVANPIEEKTESSLSLTQQFESTGYYFNATPSESGRFYVQYFVVVNQSTPCNISLYANNSQNTDFSSISSLNNRTLTTQTFTNLTVALDLWIEFDNSTSEVSVTANITVFTDLDSSNSVQAIYAILPIIASVAIVAVLVGAHFKKDE